VLLLYVMIMSAIELLPSPMPTKLAGSPVQASVVKTHSCPRGPTTTPGIVGPVQV